MEYTDVQTVFMRLDEAQEHRYPGNPKGHDLEGIKTAIVKFGFVAPLLFDENTGKFVAGHGRLDALAALKAADEPAPKRIQVDDDGEWMVPVIRGIAFDSEEEARAYVMADNKLTMNGEWDDKALHDFMAGIPQDLLDSTGFSTEEMDELAREFDAKSEGETAAREEVDEDQADALLAKWRVQPGQLWRVGKHFLMCGDSLDPQVVMNLMQGERATLAFLDPAYGVSYGERKVGDLVRYVPVGSKSLEPADLEEFCVKFLSCVMIASQEAWSAYICYPDIFRAPISNATMALRILRCDLPIIWVKNHFSVLGRSTETQLYHQKSESLLWIGPNTKNKKAWSGPNNETNIWEIDRVGGKDRIAPTQKPVELSERAIKNSSHAGDAVLDLFAGTGSSLVAAEAQGRRCYAVELDPGYCALTLERMSALTTEIEPVSYQQALLPEMPEVWRVRSFHLSNDQAKIVDKALKIIARTLKGKNTEGRALEFMAGDFLAGSPEVIMGSEDDVAA